MQVTCPACQKTSQSKSDISGKSVKCSCGKTFVVPSATGTPQATTGAVALTAKIPVQCSCGKSLQAPAAAAGKAVKCTCGQVIRVPAQTSAGQRAAAPQTAEAARMADPMAQLMSTAASFSPAHNAFGDMSDAEWQNMVQSHTPQPVAQAKPKEKSSGAKLLEQARQDAGNVNESAMESALSFLNKTRAILVGLGILCLIRSVITFWLLSSMVDAMSGGDPDRVAPLKIVVMIFCGLDIGIAILYIVLGFMVSIFPLTCTITATVVFTLVEIASAITNPRSLFSPAAWVFRIVVFGGLIQGINNAAYFRHLQAEDKAAKKAFHT